MGLKYFYLVALLLLTFASQANDCSPTAYQEKTLSRSDVKMVQSMAEAQTNFLSIYSDPRRLRNRFYWSEKEKSFIAETSKVPNTFPQRVIQKIEAALTNHYADVVYYADLGHFHILVPKGRIKNSSDVQPALESPETKFLFHTAELFQFREGDILHGPFTEDPWLQWRYYSRNFVALNDSSDSLTVLFAVPPAQYNTVRELPGFVQIATLYFSANKQGCFSFHQNGQPFNLDMTLNP